MSRICNMRIPAIPRNPRIYETDWYFVRMFLVINKDVIFIFYFLPLFFL